MVGSMFRTWKAWGLLQQRAGCGDPSSQGVETGGICEFHGSVEETCPSRPHLHPQKGKKLKAKVQSYTMDNTVLKMDDYHVLTTLSA